MITRGEIQQFLAAEFSDRFMETSLDVHLGSDFLFIRDLSYLKRDPFPFPLEKPLDESRQQAIRAWAAEPIF